MKNIFQNLKLENIKDNLIHTSKRFPTAVIISLIITLLLFYVVHFAQSDDPATLVRIVLSLVITFFLSVSITIYSESESLPRKKKNLFQIFPLAFGWFFFLSFSANLDNIENIVFFCLSLWGILGFLFFAPYTKKLLRNKGKKSIYYSYFYRIAIVFFKAIVLGWLLFILGMIAVQAVIALFDISFTSMDKIIWDWATLSLALFAPLFALSEVPKDFQTKEYPENTFSSFLIKYVATPFICVYFIILYAYSLKVLLNFSDWPKWEVTWLVIGFSVFGYIVYIFSYAQEKKQKLIKTFRKYFPYAVIPQLWMLFYAIYLRINQYDITINRYFVVVFGIWLLLISLYFVFSKRKYLWYIPALLTLFTIIVSIWPWSVYNLPENRQLSRLTSNLSVANMLTSEWIQAAPADIDPKLSGEIYDGINYICKLNNCDSIKDVFSKQYEEFVIEHQKDFDDNQAREIEWYKDSPAMIKSIEDREYRDPSRWEIVSAITDKMQVEKYYTRNQPENIYHNFYLNAEQSQHFPISVVWYEKLIRIDQGNFGLKLQTYISINSLSETLSIVIDWKIQETINIWDVFIELKSIGSEWREALSNNEMTFDIRWESIEGRLFLENISFQKNSSDVTEDRGYASWYMLIRQ